MPNNDSSKNCRVRAASAVAPKDQIPTNDEDNALPLKDAVKEHRLTMLCQLLYQGKSQKECARRFEVSDRTIRNWIGELEKNGLPTPVRMDVQRQMMLQLVVKDPAIEQWLREQIREAYNAGDLERARRLLKDLTDLQQKQWSRLCDLDRNGRIRDTIVTPPSDDEVPLNSLLMYLQAQDLSDLAINDDTFGDDGRDDDDRSSDD